MKELGARWKALDDEEKAPYERVSCMFMCVCLHWVMYVVHVCMHAQCGIGRPRLTHHQHNIPPTPPQLNKKDKVRFEKEKAAFEKAGGVFTTKVRVCVCVHIRACVHAPIPPVHPHTQPHPHTHTRKRQKKKGSPSPQKAKKGAKGKGKAKAAPPRKKKDPVRLCVLWCARVYWRVCMSRDRPNLCMYYI